MAFLVLADNTDALNLAEAPITSGMSRELHAMPGDRTLIVKVSRPEPPPRRLFQKFTLLRILRSIYKKTVPLRREVREYARVSAEGAPTLRHLQRFCGIIRTDKGPGLIVEAVRRKNGALAFTLKELIESGKYDHRSDAALKEFLHWFVNSKIVAADVHLNNIVLSEKDNCFVLIDGIGDKTFIPVRAWLPAVNCRYKARLARSIYADVAKHYMKLSLNRPLLIFAVMAVGAALGIDLMDGQLFDG